VSPCGSRRTLLTNAGLLAAQNLDVGKFVKSSRPSSFFGVVGAQRADISKKNP
jgi:hypothetical protein